MSVSASNEQNPCYAQVAKAALKIAKVLLQKEKKGRPALCLNVNIPPDYKGIKVVPLGIRCYDETVVEKKTKKGTYYKLAGRFISGKKNRNSDIDAIEQGFISVTPLELDHTSFTKIKNYKTLEKIL